MESNGEHRQGKSQFDYRKVGNVHNSTYHPFYTGTSGMFQKQRTSQGDLKMTGGGYGEGMTKQAPKRFRVQTPAYSRN